MTSLSVLGDVTKLSPRVTRVLGQNPSHMTLQGTNSYLIHPPASPRAPIILIDTTSPHSAPQYVELVKEHLSGHGLPAIEHIILTHRHLDHTGGVAHLLQALSTLGLPSPRIWKMPNPDETALQLGERDRLTTDQALIDQLPEGLYTRYSPTQPLHPLGSGTIVSTSTQDVTLRCIDTPGHTSDSVSLVLDEEDSVFSGDTVLGEGTTVFTDLSSYMESLDALAKLQASTLYPAHGRAITGQADVSSHIQTYIKHRLDRERQIVALLRRLSQPHGLADALSVYWKKQAPTSPLGKADISLFDKDSVPIPIPLLARLLYDTQDQTVIHAGGKSILAHLEKLEKENKVRRLDTRLPEIIGMAIGSEVDAEGWSPA